MSNRYVFCPGYSEGYDTSVKLEDFNDVLEYIRNNEVEYFAVLEENTLEYCYEIEVH